MIQQTYGYSQLLHAPYHEILQALLYISSYIITEFLGEVVVVMNEQKSSIICPLHVLSIKDHLSLVLNYFYSHVHLPPTFLHSTLNESSLLSL